MIKPKRQFKLRKTIWTHEALNRGKVKHWIDEKGEIHLGKYNERE